MENSSVNTPAFGAAFRMAVRTDLLATDLVARAEQAERSGNRVAQARSLMRLSAAMGEAPEGRRARAWLASARRDPSLAGAVGEARAREVADALARSAGAARRACSAGAEDVIVTDGGCCLHPVVGEISWVPPADRKSLAASARKQLAGLEATPTGRRILGQLADLQGGKVPRRPPPPAGRSQTGNRRSIRID